MRVRLEELNTGAERALRWLRGMPVTGLVFGASLAVQLWGLTVPVDTFMRLKFSVAWDLDALQHLRLWVPWARLWIQPDPGIKIDLLFVILLGVGGLERRFGTRVAATCVLLVSPLLTIATTLVLWPLFSAGLDVLRDYLFIADTGSSSAALLCWGTVVAHLRPWHAAVALLLTAPFLLVPFTWTAHREFAFDHFTGFLGGLLLGPVVIRLLQRRVAAGVLGASE